MRFSQKCEKSLLTSSYLSVCPHETTRVPGQDTDDNTTHCVRFECWITKATNTRSEYVILIAFPLHNGYESLSVALYVHCLSCFVLNEGENGPKKKLSNFRASLFVKMRFEGLNLFCVRGGRDRWT